MPRLAKMRSGVGLKAHSRPIPFSYWPTYATVPRPTVQSLLFAIDPWIVMRRAIADQVTHDASRREALAYIDQAADFYDSALRSEINAAKPVQLYYSYLNIAKAFIICRGRHAMLSTIRHGVNENIAPGGNEFDDGFVQVWRSPNQGHLQAFDELLQALGVSRFANGHQIPIPQLIPQILPGHRLWASATDSKERFISLHKVEFIENRSAKSLWLRMQLFADDLRRLNCNQNNLLSLSGLSADFRKVKFDKKVDGREIVCVEAKQTVVYVRHGVDVASQLIDDVKSLLWATVAAVTPYRRYYLYLCPSVEQPSLMPQLASIYALTFYLGSVTRYRPNAFREILDGKFGPRIAEFVSGQPAQFVYLMASEFMKRDVTKPSIV